MSLLPSLVATLLVVAAPAPAVEAPPPADAAVTPSGGRGVAVPTEEAWGDEWFDEDARAKAALEEQRILDAARERLARSQAEAARAREVERDREAELRPPEPRPIAPVEAGFGALDAAWRERRAALRRQDREGAVKAEALLGELRGELDVPEIHAFASAAIRESRRLEDVDAGEAVARAELAVALGRSLPAAHLQLARARFLAAPGEVRAWWRPLGDGLAAGLAEPRFRAPALAELLGAVLLGVLAAGAAVLLVLVGRHGRLVLHDFHHLFPRAATPVQTGALALLLAAAPLLLGLGPVVFAATLAGAIVWYLGRAERWLLAGWLAIAGLAPLAAPALGSLAAWDPVRDEGAWALERAGDFSLAPALEARANLPNADPEVLFAVARAKKRAGDLDAAAALYERALDGRPRWAAALVNLGNVRFLQGRLADAEALYGRAIDAAPGLAAAYFDLSRLHYRRVDLGPGQEARNRALELDRNLVSRYAEDRDDVSPRANRYLLDVPLQPGELAGTAAPADLALLEAEAARLLLGPVPAAAAPWLVAALLAVLGGLSLAAGRLTPARSCGKCGRPSCPRCDPETRGGGLCGQCVHVFARKAPVDPIARVQKEIAVQRHAARRRTTARALAFVLASQVLHGRVVRGALLLAAAVALVALVAAPGGWIRPAPGGLPAALRLSVAAPLLVAVWWFGVRDGLGREG